MIKGLTYWKATNGRHIPLSFLSDSHLLSLMDKLSAKLQQQSDTEIERTLSQLGRLKMYRRQKGISVPEVGNPFYNKANLAFTTPGQDKEILDRLVLFARSSDTLSLVNQIVDAYLVLTEERYRWYFQS